MRKKWFLLLSYSVCVNQYQGAVNTWIDNSGICKPWIGDRTVCLSSHATIGLFCRWPDTVLSMQGYPRTVVLSLFLSLTPVGADLCPSKPIYGYSIPTSLEQDKYPLLWKELFLWTFSDRVCKLKRCGVTFIPSFYTRDSTLSILETMCLRYKCRQVCIFVWNHT